MADFDHIAVPVDGSEGSLRAARFAVRMSRALGVPLKLVYVVAMTPESVMGLSRLSREEIKSIHKSNTDTVFSEARKALGDAGPDIDEVALVGDPAEEILSYIERNPGALVIMGRRGLSPVKSLLLGSVSEKVLRSASGVVTLVN